MSAEARKRIRPKSAPGLSGDAAKRLMLENIVGSASEKTEILVGLLTAVVEEINAKWAEAEPGDVLGICFQVQVIRSHRQDAASDEWRQSVWRRDGFCCQDCGSQRELNAHHIKEWALYPDLRYDVDNGQTLCQACHSTRHPDLPMMQVRKPRRGSQK